MTFAFLIPLAARLVGDERAKGLARVLGYALLAVALVALLAIGKCSYDNHRDEQHDLEVKAKVATSTLQADRTANANAAATQVQRQAEAAEMRGDISNAAQAHPSEARESSGPVTDAVVERMRRRAAERR